MLKVRNPFRTTHRVNATFPHLAPDSPLRELHSVQAGPFRVVCLPQQRGGFVASVVEAPEIQVYARTRTQAEQEATKAYTHKHRRNPAITEHPLAQTKLFEVELIWDPEENLYYTEVPSVNHISDYGKDEMQALDRTAEALLAYLDTCLKKGYPMPLSRRKAERIIEFLRQAA
jgi:predicted RNase H-like HicB family nuclease